MLFSFKNLLAREKQSISFFPAHSNQYINSFLKEDTLAFVCKTVTVFPCIDRFILFILLNTSAKYANLNTLSLSFKMEGSLLGGPHSASYVRNMTGIQAEDAVFPGRPLNCGT